MTPVSSAMPTETSESVRRRAPLKSVSTRIILCVFGSTLMTALVVSWLSVGAIHRDVRARVTARSSAVLAQRSHEIQSWHSIASAKLTMAAHSGSEWHDELIRQLDKDTFASVLEWTSEEVARGNSEGKAGQVSLLPAPPPDLAQYFDRLTLHRGLHAQIERPHCLSTRVDIVRDANGVAGQLEGCLSERMLFGLLQGSGDDLHGLRLLIIDPAGTVSTAAGVRSDRRLGQAVPMSELLYPTEGALVHYADQTGSRLVGSISSLGVTSWHLAVEADHSQVFAPAIALTNQIFIVDVCIILLFSVLAYKISLAIMQPIEALSEGAQRIAEGHVDYQIPIPENDDDELGALTHAFNSMMSKLRSSQIEIEQDRVRLAEKNEELQRANEILAQLSITDGLTKLHNHRYFQDHLTREIKRVSRTQAPLALILLDIDDFKLLNDTHGHAAGDEVLMSLASILNDSARESDLIARYGGEEFVILMPNTDLAGAVHLAEKVRMAVEVTRLIIGDNMNPANITVSIGVALFSGNRRDFFAEADKSLYRAKGAGKNCVIISEPENSPIS
jgi:diguanylate cyclase (GGDEF)-like protein